MPHSEVSNKDITSTLLDNALKLHDAGKLPEAQEIYLKILAINPKNFIALHQMGVIAYYSDNYSMALAYSNEALKSNPTCALPINTIGLIFLKQKQFDKAETCFKKCTILDPNLSEAYQNVGVALDKQKKFPEALDWYAKALSVQPTNKMPLFNIGAIHASIGELTKAENIYKKILPTTNYNIEVIYGRASNLLSLFKYKEMHDFISEIESNQYLSKFQLAGLKIINAIVYAIENNHPMVENTIKELDGLSSTEARFPNYDQLIIFFKYLDKLVKFRKNNPEIYEQTSKSKLFIAGESHCLSPAHTLLDLDGMEYVCIPKFVMGAQARHFGAKNNKYKASLDFVLNDIPKNSIMVAMFGEIDCRITSGIFPYHRKIGKTDKQSVDCTINEIVTGYVNYFIKITKKKKCKLMFYGVPARNICISPLPEEDKQLIDYIIKSFNNVLGEEAEKHKVPFIDIYSLTKTDGDLASGQHHIDSFHLLPNVFAEAIRTSLKNHTSNGS